MKRIRIGYDSFAEAAHMLANEPLRAGFNAQGKKQGARSLKTAVALRAVFSDALDITTEIAGRAQGGWSLYTGSAWHGPDLLLSRDRAAGLSADPLPARMTKEMSFRKDDVAKISNIRRAFGLRSDREAVRLAIWTRRKLVDGVRRGNSFHFMKDDSRTPLYARFDTSRYQPKPLP